MTTTESALLMSMSDIAALARVQRPVVSVWRTRAARTHLPFPVPVVRERDRLPACCHASWNALDWRANSGLSSPP